MSVLKKICHDNGLVRWPYRKFLSGKTIEEIKEEATREKSKELAELSRAASQKNDALGSSAVSTLGTYLHSKSSSSVPEASKLQGVTPPRVSQLQGNKNFQNGQFHNNLNSSFTIGVPTCMDEFKHGFPSNGLSTACNKWWGNGSPDGNRDTSGHEAETDKGNKLQPEEVINDGLGLLTVDNEQPEAENEGTEIGPQGTGSLSAVRKRSVEEGRKALELGLYKRNGANKLGRREKILLHQIFESSLSGEWR